MDRQLQLTFPARRGVLGLRGLGFRVLGLRDLEGCCRVDRGSLGFCGFWDLGSGACLGVGFFRITV